MDVDGPKTNEAYFVIDGQQRIVALAGAILRDDKHPRGDIRAVWFDLEEESFVRAQGSEVPPHWIPLNVAGDSIKLLSWLNDWPLRNERRDLVERAITTSKAVREYQIPAYIVETADEDVPRVIFKRLNNSGVAMQESEVFEALYHASEPRPLAQACARLEEETGFGEVSTDWFLRCLKVVEGIELSKSFENLEDDAVALSTGSRRFEDVRIESFKPMAEIVDVPFEDVARWVREMAEHTMAAFFDPAADLPFSAAERARLVQHVRRVPLSAPAR